LGNFADDPAEVDLWHRTWGAAQSVAARPPTKDKNIGRALRVGYVSADFRRHSVAFFIEPLLRHHDPAATDVFVYANVAAPDEVTRRLQGYAKNWRSIVGLNGTQVCDLIRADGIDILVDLSGHTQGNRLDVFAARPAPLQLTGIGYPGSTGLTAFDGRLCDAITDPVGDERFSTEPPFRLPAFHCYQPPATAPACARNGSGMVFGSFNKLAKLSDRTVALWARVLGEVPGAKLKLKTKPLTEAETRVDVTARFAAAGVAADRLILSGWLPEDSDHLAAYNEIDVALDTFPYNGTTTTCEALWMGVPVVTRAGRTHAARVGASLLASIGHPEWAAEDDDAFVAKAVAFANDREALRAIRTTLRDQVAASRLCARVLTPADRRRQKTAWSSMPPRPSPQSGRRTDGRSTRQCRTRWRARS
jgi:protein O-GlcNAc transferase